MKMLLTLIVALLAGCGASEADNNNHGYGDHYDVLGASGMRFRYSPALTASDERARVSTYEQEFKEVQECTGLSAPAPFVIIVQAGSISPAQGRYLSNPSVILLDPSNSEIVIKHESVHYLLDMNGGNPHPNHDHPLFLKCSLKLK